MARRPVSGTPSKEPTGAGAAAAAWAGEPTPTDGLPAITTELGGTPSGRAAGRPEEVGAADGEDAGGGALSQDPRQRRHGPGGHRRPPSRRRRLLRAGAVAVLLVAVAGIAWYEIEAHPFGGPGRQELVTVRQGESAGQVVDDLASKGVVGSAIALRLSFVVHGTPTVLPGGYFFHRNQSFATVRAILTAGPDVFPVTVYPGATLREVASQLDAVPHHSRAMFLEEAASGAVRSPFDPPGSTNLEGLVGTGTYLVLPGETDRQLLTQMVDRFDRTAAAVGLTGPAAAKLGIDPYQAVIVASIVEKEGYIEKNMGPVARVIYNRLAQGMPLQMDSTVLYSLGQDGGKVTPADEQLDTPYNTYLHTGLTPTPTCTPSAAALAAALSPPPGRWVYFVVVKKDGTEAFSDTYAGQMANESLARSRGLG
jgi:UPF0755 protein